MTSADRAHNPPPPIAEPAPVSVEDYARRVLTAQVYDAAVETPLESMSRLSARLGRSVFLKREDLQPVFSFKVRGAYNKIAQLASSHPITGAICASAGNHAQGVALAARSLGVPSVVVMPTATPAIKVDAVRALGAEVVLHGENFDAALAHARGVAGERGLAFVHPFDDPDVIAGQGTVGAEILRQHPGEISTIFLPVGGGGLAAGVAAFVKFLRPGVRIVGVEPEDAASMAAALAHGAPVELARVGSFADGAAVRRVGEETFRVCRALLDDCISVTTDEICAAIKDIFEDTRAMAEPAGALSLAGLKAYVGRCADGQGSLIAVNSGANLDFDRLRYVSEQAEMGEEREALLAVTIPERKGSYRALVNVLEHERVVTEFNYRRGAGASAHILLGVRISGRHDKQQLIADLGRAGCPVVDLTADEAAKLHLRYMVGGRCPSPQDECVFRFEFPERPGALRRFVNRLGEAWNISLFHYRNRGGDAGQVLAGFEVPSGQRGAFRDEVAELGYAHWDETDNPVYRLFLR